MDRLWTPWRYAYVIGSDTGAPDTTPTAAPDSAGVAASPGAQNAPDPAPPPSFAPHQDAATAARPVHARPPARRTGVPEALSAWPGDHGCVFCNMIAAVDFAVANGTAPDQAEAEAGILERGPACFLVLNAFPYNSGHLMVLPYLHEESLAALPLPVAGELMRLTRRAERVLRAVYRPDGLNLGLNLGQSAGAGVAGHLHLHAVPRWSGDSNFMSVLAETRILPETLDQSWRRLRAALAADPPEFPNPA